MQHGRDRSDLISWASAGARAAQDHFGRDTLLIDVAELLAVCDFFVITSGANQRQVKAICEAVIEGVSAAGGPKPLSVEGLTARSWVLVDYGDFVVHVFSEQGRDYYQLERLWGDCPRLSWDLEPVAEAG
ncbi:MAG: ribosome silencing factor [Acidimicrobiia bacterium]|nr:ribosome silencing factor [Acidimicrobiia bacterium]